MIRVLHVFPKMNNAGTEKVILNLYNNIDREKIQFDFLLNEQGELDDEIKNLGGKIFYVDKNCASKDYYKKLIDFFCNNNYEVVHVHTHENMLLALKAAKKSGVKCRIIHSHNSRQDLPKILKLFRLHRNLEIEKYATDFLACSKEAAKWLYPTKYKYTKIIFNAIDIKKFIYNENVRKNVRKKIKIKDNEKIIISVGRFARQKNHTRFVKIAKKLAEKKSDLKFVFVGTGPLEDKIKCEVEKNGLENKFIFLGNRNDVNELLMASDLFLFPTLHEGLGIVLVEAQFSGLNCITSDIVPEEADIGLNLIKKINLRKSNKYWSNQVINVLERVKDRNINEKFINSANYNIKNIASDVQEFYLSRMEKGNKNEGE